MVSTSILSELHPFFYPRAIAVIGVSREPSKFGSCAFRALKDFGFNGSLYPVGRQATELLGMPVYQSISAIPGAVDLARICLPAPLVPEAIRECQQKGIPAVEVLSGGFGETGTDEGKRLQEELASLAGNGMRILGPNCFGVYSPAGGVTQLPGAKYPHEAGQVGFFSQSGGITEDMCRVCRDYGLRISQAVSYGNACDITEVDLLQYFEADSSTGIITGYIEGLKGEGREFFDTVRWMALRKPVILLKGGSTPSGARAVASHTASLAGSEKAWDALFRQTGVIEVHTLEELLDTASAFYHLPPQADPRVALVCGAGGVSVTASDTCYHAGLTLPTLDEEVQRKLNSFLAPIGTSSRNPVDCDNPFPPAELLRDVLETVAASGNVGSIIIDKIALSVKMRQLMGYTEQVPWEDKPWLRELPVQVRKQWNIPVLVVLREGGDLPDEMSCEAERRQLRRYYQEEGVAVYPTMERALKSLGKMIKYYQRQQEIGGHSA